MTWTVVCTENSIRVDHVSKSPNVSDDDRAFCLCVALFVLPFKSKRRLEAEERGAPASAHHIAAESARHICETSRYRAVFERPSYLTR